MPAHFVQLVPAREPKRLFPLPSLVFESSHIPCPCFCNPGRKQGLYASKTESRRVDPPLCVRAVYGIAISMSRFLIQAHASHHEFPDYPMRSYTKNDVFIQSILSLFSGSLISVHFFISGNY